MKKNRTNTNAFETFRKSLIPAVLITPCLLAPISCFAVDFTGTLDSVTIADAEGTNIPPSASFTYTVNGDNVTFDASGSTDPDGSITGFKWDFGDGLTANGETTTHTYTEKVSFPVSLTIIDNAQGIAISQQNVDISQQTIVVEQLIEGSDTGNIHSTRNYSQGFYLASDTTISSIVIKSAGNIYGKTPMAIRIGNAKNLSNSSIAESDEVIVSTTYTEYEFSFVPPVSLSAHTQYYFVAGSTDNSTSHWTDLVSTSSDLYSPADCNECNRSYESSIKWSADGISSSKDLYFKIIQ